METLAVAEAIPDTYPEVEGLSLDARALDVAAIWRSIEAHIAWRWSPRVVIWTVQGDGDWGPPLLPVLIERVCRWTGSEWAEFEPPFGPVGLLLPDGMSKIEVIVGNN